MTEDTDVVGTIGGSGICRESVRITGTSMSAVSGGFGATARRGTADGKAGMSSGTTARGRGTADGKGGMSKAGAAVETSLVPHC